MSASNHPGLRLAGLTRIAGFLEKTVAVTGEASCGFLSFCGSGAFGD
ncbi:MAG TPA: hypothetical protein PLL33_03430 [Paracoccus sp. (in: a-proteobacteria)]|nr:hypothetical protein [Paracoccus sp. (in: a-proteobacteria)]